MQVPLSVFGFFYPGIFQCRFHCLYLASFTLEFSSAGSTVCIWLRLTLEFSSAGSTLCIRPLTPPSPPLFIQPYSDPGIFHCSFLPSAYSLLSSLCHLLSSSLLSSKYFLYNSNAVLESSILSCVPDWISTSGENKINTTKVLID